jgi:hypothetical protein
LGRQETFRLVMRIVFWNLQIESMTFKEHRTSNTFPAMD